MQLTLIGKSHLGDNAWCFNFQPEYPIPWLAGQFMHVKLDHNEPDAEGTRRFFTIAAAPHDRTLTIATRITATSFKRALAALPLGGRLEMLEQPAGDFLWRPLPASRPHVFAAQGIGITPFYAIIKDRIHRSLPVSATLMYAHHPETEALFAAELTAWAAEDPTLRLELRSGTLTAAQVAVVVPDIATRLVYVSGPKSFLSLCLPPHNLPLTHLKQDNFPGYSSANY